MKSVQFNLRQLLLASVFCSITFAIAAPLLREFPESRLIWMAAALSAGAVVFCLAMLRLIDQRKQFELAGGKIRLALRQPTRGAGMVLSGIAAAEFLIIAVMAIGGGDFIGTVAPMLLAGCVAPMWSKVALLYIWGIGESTLELYENAVIVGGLRYYRWTQVTSYDWTEASGVSMLWLAFDDQLVGAVMALHERQEIESLLAEKVFPAGRHDDAVSAENEPFDSEVLTAAVDPECAQGNKIP